MTFAFEVLRAQWRYRLVLPYSFNTDILPAEDLFIGKYVKLTTDGVLTMGVGYAWDGPSGPTLDTPDTMRASLIHDALYQLMGKHLDRKHRKRADQIFREVLLVDKMPRFRAWYYYWAVRAFGGIALWWASK